MAARTNVPPAAVSTDHALSLSVARLRTSLHRVSFSVAISCHRRGAVGSGAVGPASLSEEVYELTSLGMVLLVLADQISEHRRSPLPSSD